MIIEPEHGARITITGANRTLAITHAGQYLHAHTPGGVTVLETRPSGSAALLLFDNDSDFRRWRAFTTDPNSFVYLVNPDGSLELVARPPRKESDPCPESSTTS